LELININSPKLDAEAEQIEQSGADIRLRRDAALTPLDVELLMVALLPDLDSRFERLYGYLNDDVTRRRASVGLALQLAGASGLSAAARSRLESPGRGGGVEEPVRASSCRGPRVRKRRRCWPRPGAPRLDDALEPAS
jgi:hypothetical protein